MAKFKLSKFFPNKDIQKLKDLAKEGIMFYPLLSSLNSEDINYALAILKANNIKVGALIKKEMNSDTPCADYDEFSRYILENKINLLTYDELLEHYDYEMSHKVVDYTYAKTHFNSHTLNDYYSLKDENEENANPIPIVILLYIRYIQQDGKL